MIKLIDILREVLTETYDQNAIKQVFKSHPELAGIGTPEQYSSYLSTIFPSSKIRDIVYHSSPNKIEKFRGSMFGTYFSYSPIEGVYGGVVHSALLNVKNPLIKPKPSDSPEEKAAYDREYRSYNNPSFSPEGHSTYKYDASIEGSTVTKEGEQIKVRDPEQIHILGSKEDIEGFKEYVQKKITERSNEIRENNYRVSKPQIDRDEEDGSILSVSYHFNTDKNRYEVIFNSFEKPRIFEVEFGIDKGETFGLDTDEMTGEGKALSILSTVAGIINSFLQNFSDEYDKVIISGTNEKRKEVYRKFFPKKINPEYLDKVVIREGIDDPVRPGILKKRLGKLSCSRVRSAKSKLKNKGTHYAKALQRYLNYHC